MNTPEPRRDLCPECGRDQPSSGLSPLAHRRRFMLALLIPLVFMVVVVAILTMEGRTTGIASGGRSAQLVDPPFTNAHIQQIADEGQTRILPARSRAPCSTCSATACTSSPARSVSRLASIDPAVHG